MNAYIILLFTFVHAEVFHINNLHIKENTVIPAKWFVYDNNNTITNMNNSFEYNISIDKDGSSSNNTNNVIGNVILLNTNAIGFNMMKYPGICCSPNGTPIFCLTSPPSSFQQSNNVYDYSIYHNTITFSSNTDTPSTYSFSSHSLKGHTVLLLTFCNVTHDTPLHISATFTFTNAYSQYTITDSFRLPILVIYLITIIAFAVYWYMRIPKHHHTVKFDMKLLSMATPFIISYHITSLFMYFIKPSSSLSSNNNNTYLFLFIVRLTLQTVNTVYIKLAYFLVSIGYTFNLQIRLFKSATRNIFSIPKSKVNFISLLLCLYVIALWYTELINRIRQYEYTDCFGYYLAVALKIWINCFIWYGVYTRISKKSEFQMNTFISIKMYFKQYNKVIIVAFVCGVCYYVSSCVVMVVNECAFAKVAFAVNTLLNELSDVVLYGGLVVLTLETPMQYSSNSSNNNNNSNSDVGSSNRKYTKYHGDVFYEMQHACLNSLDKIE